MTNDKQREWRGELIEGLASMGEIHKDCVAIDIPDLENIVEALLDKTRKEVAMDALNVVGGMASLTVASDSEGNIYRDEHRYTTKEIRGYFSEFKDKYLKD